MSSFSNSSASPSNEVVGQRTRCYCGGYIVMRTSWQLGSFRRRFRTCLEYQPNQCGYFKWFDERVCERGIKVGIKVLEKIDKLKAEIGKLEAKNAKLEAENSKVEKEEEMTSRAQDEMILVKYENMKLAEEAMQCRRREKIVVKIALGSWFLFVIALLINNLSGKMPKK